MKREFVLQKGVLKNFFKFNIVRFVQKWGLSVEFISLTCMRAGGAVTRVFRPGSWGKFPLSSPHDYRPEVVFLIVRFSKGMPTIYSLIPENGLM